MSAKSTAAPNLEALIASFLATVRPARRSDVESSLDLLQTAFDSYAHQYLTAADSARLAAAIAASGRGEGDDDIPMSQVFGARLLAKYLDEFFGYFMIRKVMLAAEEVGATVEHVREFVSWLARTGAMTPAAAKTALRQAAVAAEELPAAEALSQQLYRLAERTSEVAASRRLQYDEVVEDYLVIERVAPGRLWFIDGLGPVKVPEAASRLARAGWTVNLVLGRIGDQWDVLEVGNVYPQTLA